jgi:hypothetical protein
MSDLLRCPICGRRGRRYLTRDGVLEHLVADHAQRAVAEELLTVMDLARAVQRNATFDRRCGKKRYATEQKAMQGLLTAWRVHDPRRREVRAYQCDRCDGAWHLTSQPRGEEATA